MSALPDPDKWLAVFERLFGQRTGRLIAQGLLALASVAAGVFLIHVIWEYGAKSVFSSLSVPSFQLPTLDAIQAAVLTLMFFVIIYSGALLAILYLFMRRVFRKQVPQRVIDELAELRSRAIHDIWNAKVKSEEQLDALKQVIKGWNMEVGNVLKEHFPKSEVLGFERLGIVHMAAPWNVYNGDHAHEMMMFAKRLGTLEDIIKRYSR